jgi:hypothetical protein
VNFPGVTAFWAGAENDEETRNMKRIRKKAERGFMVCLPGKVVDAKIRQEHPEANFFH